jgi:hypothetical protein
MNASILPLTAAEYHADPCIRPSLSNSIAQVLIDQSPAHAWLKHPRLNPNYESEKDSKFDLGSAAHVMLLERRNDCIVRVNADDWRTKAAREARDAAQANGQYAVLERQYNDIEAMVRAARQFVDDTELAGILSTGDAEHTVTWQEGSIWCRIRPDLLSADRRIILDYKTTPSAHPDAFIMQIGRMGYDLQAEFYVRGVEDLTGLESTFVFLCQESKPPYACSLVALANSYREVGKSKVNAAMRVWSECMITNAWYGYSNKIHYADPKPWDLIRAEAAMAAGSSEEAA